ncbi:MAG: hypothetical protein COW00_18985 [Bdellovibrio sp. CG12_big_fil_rev_8_21_14_0_65_39_13]|nr:MAG: hypothetical protein COW78_17290 [Bdellovibrio sp. CG22_combo_CG10-13_8_21_14_all_39_27]PIQ57783.1 MAG: hypothetical protein COW00_18985 [Bdellovibrio sp. CG12_big_fil_rev_8_21_14_0_65_39_13]PIR34657.1 MAG: hypothetical protein COV37_12035 [Bdellovibrio sp. CG11_big_fil_rev_8_21_14_0_20_39_38]
MNVDQGFREYKQESIKQVAPWGVFVFVLLSIVDNSLVGDQWPKFFGIRLLFGLPMLFVYFYSKKYHLKNIHFLSLLSLFSIYLGVSIASYHIGGITSDYYFGMVIVSFLQFIFFPFGLVTTIALDLVANVIFFIVNTWNIDFDHALLIKQVTNLLSFMGLKFLAINRFNKMFENNVRLISVQRSMEAKQKMQKLMGELCHLLNNPMFIAMNFTKKITKTKEIDRAHEYAFKSLASIQRMKEVSSVMLKIYDGKESDIINENSTDNRAGLLENS